MNRVVIVLASVVLSTSGCLTALNPVVFTRDLEAPAVPARPEGCLVEVHDDNGPPRRPHKVIGRLELDWGASRMKEQGGEGAIRTLQVAACEYGGHALVNMRVLPRGFNEGFLYEADLAVFLDDKGELLIGKASGTSSSSSSVTGTSVEPAPGGAAAPTTSTP